jgi:hypothetical protein
MSSETEAQLIARCRQGDARAWDTLFELHYAAATRFVFQLSHSFSAEDVEEICQEAFLAVIKNIHSRSAPDPAQNQSQRLPRVTGKVQVGGGSEFEIEAQPPAPPKSPGP